VRLCKDLQAKPIKRGENLRQTRVSCVYQLKLSVYWAFS